MSHAVDAADMVPVRQGEWHEGADGRVGVTRRKFGRFGTAMLRLARVKPDVTLKLDAMGSAAWRLMDGRTVAEMLPSLEAAFSEEGRLDERFGLYLSRLVQAGVVRLEPAD